MLEAKIVVAFFIYVLLFSSQSSSVDGEGDILFPNRYCLSLFPNEIFPYYDLTAWKGYIKSSSPLSTEQQPQMEIIKAK